MLPIITLDSADDFDITTKEGEVVATMNAPSEKVIREIKGIGKCIVEIRLPRINHTLRPITRISSGMKILGDLEEVVEFRILDWGRVRIIEKSAFEKCENLTIIPSQWRWVRIIEDEAFSDTGITKLPEDFSIIEKIGDLAFFSCKNLTELPEAIFVTPIEFGTGVFSHCPIREVKRWGVLKNIPNYFFENSKVERIPNDWGNIQEIGMGAFMSCHISDVPDNWGKIERIGVLAFNENNISHIPLREDPLKYGESFAFVDNPGYDDFLKYVKKLKREIPVVKWKPDFRGRYHFRDLQRAREEAEKAARENVYNT